MTDDRKRIDDFREYLFALKAEDKYDFTETVEFKRYRFLLAQIDKRDSLLRFIAQLLAANEVEGFENAIADIREALGE